MKCNKRNSHRQKVSLRRYQITLGRKKHLENKQSGILMTSKRLGKLESIFNSKPIINIRPPKNFSFIASPQKALHFFSRLKYFVNKRRRIFIDMKSLDDITIDVLLYFLAFFEDLKFNGIESRILGNEPTKRRCKDLLLESGFYDYVYSNSLKHQVSSSTISIKRGIKVDPQIAAEVKLFTKEKLKKDESPETKAIHITLIELMANAHNHAYSRKTNMTKWWLIARHNEKDKRVSYAFLDTGVGIPKTVKARNREKVLSLLGKSPKDSNLMFSAFKGDFRTQTGLVNRGKGLPKILEHNRCNIIENLVVISRNGFIFNGDERIVELKQRFRGTLFSWDFV